MGSATVMEIQVIFEGIGNDPWIPSDFFSCSTHGVIPKVQ